MTKRYLTTAADGSLSITMIAGEDPLGHKLNKQLYELSRTSDVGTKFDPDTHTRAAIAAGLPGHNALSITAECEDTDLPDDRYFRDAWEWTDDAD